MSEAEFGGQVAVVTGGAAGIGFAISRLLTERGATVCLLDVNKQAMDDAVAKLNKAGGKAKGYVADVTKEDTLQKARDEILKEFKRTDVLVNNAGIYPKATLKEITVEGWNKMFDINALGMLLTTRTFMDQMISQKYGRIVSIITNDAYIAKPTTPHYAASKAAVLSLTKTFAAELGPHEVIVNGVSPGAVATERAKGEGWIPQRIPLIPVRRAAEPEDIAEVVLFLASKRNRFVVGETVVANGGFTML